MENEKQRICSFYVSDWHLTAMLLPFIEEKVEKGETLNTILEKNITYNMKEILNRIQLKEKIKEKILEIDWKNRKLKRKEIMIINCYEVSEFNQSLQEILDNHDKILNTSGIHEIEEIYAGYIRKRA